VVQGIRRAELVDPLRHELGGLDVRRPIQRALHGDTAAESGGRPRRGMETGPPVYLRCVGGTHNGSSLPVFAPLVEEGTHCAFPPPAAFQAVRDAPKDEPVRQKPDDTWKRYLVAKQEDGFILVFLGTLTNAPPAWNPFYRPTVS
jgi:hypothetical protein